MNSELSMDQVLIEKLIKILEVNLDMEHFGVKDLAREVGLSRSQLHRKLQSITGKSTSKFIREYRLERAMELLSDNVATASEIAYRVGFSSPTYFNTSFHDYYGYPPGEVKYRNPNDTEHKTTSENLELVDDSQIVNETLPIKKGLITKRIVWVNSFLIILLALVSYNLYQNYKDSPAEEMAYKEEHDKSIAILPFKNLSDDIENQYFADGVSGAIQNNLSKISNLMVIPSTSMEKYRNTDLSATEIANEVNVFYLLEGSVQKHGDSIRVISNLVDAKSHEQLQSFVFDWEYKNIFEIQSKIALEVAKELRVTIDPEKLKTLQKQPTENVEAYNLYLKGRFFWHRRTLEDLNKSIYYYEQALELDSTYALAYAGLADSYLIMAWRGSMSQKEAFKKAKEFAFKSLSIDKTIVEAYATLASIATWDEWNWKEAEKKIKYAIALNPNYATAYQWYAELLDILDRKNEAIEQINMALKLNPNSYMMNATSAMLNVKAGNFEMATIAAQRAKEIDKSEGWAYWILFECYWNIGLEDKAIAEMEKWWYLEPNIELAEGSRKAYDNEGIKGVYKYIVNYDLETGNAHKQPLLMAEKYAFFGEKEIALDWLEKAYEMRIIGVTGDLGIPQIKGNQYFKSLRTEPRFLALLKKMNLGDYE